MLRFTSPDPGVFTNPSDPNPLHLLNPEGQPGRERLRHLIIGFPAGIRATLNRLHVLQYAERSQWSKVLTVPQSGVLITPEQGEAFSYLLRWHQLD